MPATALTIAPVSKPGNSYDNYIPKYPTQIEPPEPGKPAASDESSLGVRRPIRGIRLKKNTYAYVQILDEAGQPVKDLNRIGLDNEGNVITEKSDTWTDWVLQAVQEGRTEKSQIVETFGESFVYFFGERPRVLRFDGILMNTADFNWRAEFWDNWENYFRGTRLVEKNYRLLISFDDILVEGYPLNANAVQTGNDPNSIRFSFTFFVSRYVNVYKTGSNSLVRSGVLRGEYLRAGNLADTSGAIRVNGDKLVSHQDLFLGSKLSTREYVARVFGDNTELINSVTQATGISPVNLMFNDLPYITSAKAAIDVANKYLLKQAYDNIDKGYKEMVDAIARASSVNPTGALPDTAEKVNYWFGRLSIIASWISSIEGAPFVPAELLGRPDKVAKVMAYSALSSVNRLSNFTFIPGYPGAPGDSSLLSVSESALESSTENQSKALATQEAKKEIPQPSAVVSLKDRSSFSDKYKKMKAKLGTS